MFWIALRYRRYASPKNPGAGMADLGGLRVLANGSEHLPIIPVFLSVASGKGMPHAARLRRLREDAPTYDLARNNVELVIRGGVIEVDEHVDVARCAERL